MLFNFSYFLILKPIYNNIPGESVRFFKKPLRSVLTGVASMFSQLLSIPPAVSDAHPFQDSLDHRLQDDEQHDDEYQGHDIFHSS